MLRPRSAARRCACCVLRERQSLFPAGSLRSRKRSRPQSHADGTRPRHHRARKNRASALLSLLHRIRPGFRRPRWRLWQFVEQRLRAAASSRRHHARGHARARQHPRTKPPQRRQLRHASSRQQPGCYRPRFVGTHRSRIQARCSLIAQRSNQHRRPRRRGRQIPRFLQGKTANAHWRSYRNYPEVYFASVILQVQNSKSRMVSSEGSAIVSPSSSTRLVMEAQTRAEDGMDLLRVETFQAPSASGLPGESELTAKIDKMAADLSALRKAPVAEPYDGPALLSGRAAAVFFHEVLGHRLEGHRQRDEEEGQTFTKKVGQEVLPKFLSVIDDPTTREISGVKLAGTYDFDNEGSPSQPVEVIQDGVLKNFLMSRMPIKNFSQSNGHGRNQPGLMPTGRQGNLIVTSTQTVPEADLRQKLIDEVKKQGKPFGLYFDDIQGGFTLTTRSLPQAFQVLPVIVYKVYADGRPDELVRGVDIVGTPLAALTRILTTGDQPRVFNGVCGAESGQVPVSAVAPSMLFSEMEVQKRAHEHERPPLLPPPGFEDAGAKDAQAKAEVKP